jgi:hypothetical protein
MIALYEFSQNFPCNFRFFITFFKIEFHCEIHDCAMIDSYCN